MSTRPIALPEPDTEDEPVDLVALQADDELINALASGLAVSSGDARGPDADDQVCAILAAWKAEVDAEPIPELVDLDTAVATVHAARRPSGRARHLVPVAAAAAILVMLLGGVSLGSYSAEPDDVLWPVAKVLYSERTDSVLAAERVEDRIALAKQAIAAGQPAEAERQLQAAAADIDAVRPEEGRIELVEVQEFLKAKADETPPGVPTDPGAPLTADQARKVPPGAEITSPARTSEQSSPVEQPSEEPSSSTPSSVDSEQPEPARPVDPRILRAPAPAPAEQPEVSTAPTAGDPPAEKPTDGESSATSPPAPPEQQPDPAQPGVDGGASAPEPAPDGTQSIGATAADTSTTAPSPTS